MATPPGLMTKKDSEKEVERPHYYSQFWLDVAAGRRVIGAPKPEDDEADEVEPELAEVAVGRRPEHDGLAAVTDGYQEPLAPAEVEPMFGEEEYAEPDLSEELVGAVDDLDIPNIELDEPEVAEIPQVPVVAQEEQEKEEPEPEEELTEPLYDDEEEEEEEDWTVGRGRKKAKPRAQKQPPKRQEKRRRY